MFEDAPKIPTGSRSCKYKVLGHGVETGVITVRIRRKMSFAQLQSEQAGRNHGRSSFHVDHVRPKLWAALTPLITHIDSDLGNRIQDKSWVETVKTKSSKWPNTIASKKKYCLG